MLNNNSNHIRNVKKNPFMLHGGKKGRPSLLHNKTKGGTNHKGTAAKPGKMQGMDAMDVAINALKRKK